MTFADPATDALHMKSLVQQELIKRGVLTAGGFNLCWRHDDVDIDRTLDAARATIARLARGLAERRVEAMLEGPPIQPVFRSA